MIVLHQHPQYADPLKRRAQLAALYQDCVIGLHKLSQERKAEPRD